MERKVLTVQDISCYGQCSLTVALPIISACGIETAILPSAVLSTHTGGFSGFTFRDLSSDLDGIVDHWQKTDISFDCIYTGYLGSLSQINFVKTLPERVGKKDCLFVVDPAMADNGVLYTGFNLEYARAMASLCASGDVILPNVTEACFITGTEYRNTQDKSFCIELMDKMSAMGAKNIVLTGAFRDEESITVAVRCGSEDKFYTHELMPKGSHGTGDIYASAFVGALMNGKNVYDSAVIAADFTLKCIKETAKYKDHWYGAKFEPVLKVLPELLK